MKDYEVAILMLVSVLITLFMCIQMLDSNKKVTEITISAVGSDSLIFKHRIDGEGVYPLNLNNYIYTLEIKQLKKSNDDNRK